ncbi:MAG: DUF2283 domain-containing protein [Cyanobacteria bacterium J06627_28]
MKVIYDPDRDILQLSFNQQLVEETTQITPGLILDYDEDGHIIGIEIRQASRRVDNPQEITYAIGEADTSKPDVVFDEEAKAKLRNRQ